MVIDPAASSIAPPPLSPTAVIISADAEWRAVTAIVSDPEIRRSPLGAWFVADLGTGEPVLFFHGGWGKIAAAASAQYLIDHAAPRLLLNLGTCGGFEGEVDREEILLVERTVVYDIIEQMGDPDEAIAAYTTAIDLSWLDGEAPHPVRRTLLLSGDRDLVIDEIPGLRERYDAVAGDWESGAIAYVAARNGVRLLILRGVSDLVGRAGGEAYGKPELFHDATGRIMRRLLDALPAWIARGRAGG